jgi:histidyl-tRNA synthetase
MSKVPVQPPSGFRDFLPAEASARAALIEGITRIYQSHGFQQIGMSMLENLSTLQGKGGGGDNEKLIFKVMKRGEDLKRSLEANSELADMGLRFDLTLPLARYCSHFRGHLPNPFKVFQIGPVWRADRPQKGRFREFYQCDVDIVGSKEIGAEVDCIAAILEVFSQFGLSDVEVHLNDRRLLSALGADVEDPKQWAESLVTLDKLDKIGREGVEKELMEKIGRVPFGIARIFASPGLSAFADIHPESERSLRQIIALLENQISSGQKILFNPTLVRGQDYYTGTIFEIRHPALSGSLGGGGRYNKLLEVFGGPETPAFGGSIGFERLVLLLQEQGKLADRASNPQVFFPLFGEEMRPKVLEMAAKLRKLGLRADVYPDAAKLKNQFKYAEDRKIPYVGSIGSEELAKGQVKFKDMSARSEEVLSEDDFLARITSLCKPKP